MRRRLQGFYAMRGGLEMRKLLLCFCLLGSGIFFLPKLASGKWAEQHLVSHLQKRLGGEVSCEKISLSWTDKQQCSFLHWIDQRNNISLSAESLVISDTLLNCLRFKEKPLRVSVEGATLECAPKMRVLKKKKYQRLNMVCSTIDATIDHGVVSFNKIEIDVTDSLKVVTWGTIDLDKQHINITLGLPPKAMQKLFGLKDLPENYLLEVPISCKMSSKVLEKKLLGFFLKNYATVTSLQR